MLVCFNESSMCYMEHQFNLVGFYKCIFLDIIVYMHNRFNPLSQSVSNIATFPATRLAVGQLASPHHFTMNIGTVVRSEKRLR